MDNKYRLRSAILIIVLFVFIGWVVFRGYYAWIERQAREKRNAAALEQIQHDKEEMSDNMVKALKDPNAGPQEMVKQYHQFSEKLGASSQGMSGQEKLAMEAIQGFSVRLGTQMQEYSAAFQTLQEAGFISPANLKSREDIVHRRELLSNFDKANEQVTSLCKNSQQVLEEELKSKGVDEKFIQSVLNGYRKSSNMDLILQIRQCDKDLVTEANQMLDVYDSEWGKWRVSENENVVFENQSAVEAFNKIHADIDATADKQTALQQQLIEKVKKPK